MNAGGSTLDLGRLAGPVLVFGGPYSNLEATDALLAEAARRGIAPKQMICTGDVVAYCADPSATVARIREAGIPTVMGNCEESLGAEADDCGCGFVPGTTCDRLSAAWYAHADAALPAADKAWMAGLPRRIAFTLGDRRLLAVHGAPSQINRFVFRSTPASIKRQEFALAAADAVLGGHSGLPFSQIIDGRLWHNSGALGMPANDGTPRVWFSLLSPTGTGIRIEHHALRYDHMTATAKMRHVGLPVEYYQALGSGLWDNDDILPPDETAEKGVPLSIAPLHWAAETTAEITYLPLDAGGRSPVRLRPW